MEFVVDVDGGNSLDTSIPPARGYVDVIQPSPQGIQIAGWMLIAEHEAEVIEWRTSTGEHGVVDAIARPGIVAQMGPPGRGERCGFVIDVAMPDDGPMPWIELVAVSADGARARMAQPFSQHLGEVPCPPEHLMYRVAHTTSEHFFRASGLRALSDLVLAVARHREWSTVSSLLDWGCGSGRVASLMLRSPNGVGLSGCDIDEEAVRYLNDRHGGQRFVPIDPIPPTSFESHQFDVAWSASVLTHLDRNTQSLWLEEMARVLAPGGLLVASTHGAFAASWSGVDAAELESEGVLDQTFDLTLDGIAPAGYYRATFQTEDYTRSSFAPWFEVLEIRTAGAGNFQDLVVARRS